MLKLKKLAICHLVYIAALSLAAPQSATSQTSTASSTDQENTLKVLLNEVRLLRLALERNNQSHIILERLRAQQEKVDFTSRDLEDARKQLAELSSSPTQLQEQLDEAEKKVEAGLADSRHYRSLKAEMEQQTRLQQRLHEREGYLSTQLEKERAKLTELNDRLDILERLMQEAERDQRQRQKGERKKQ